MRKFDGGASPKLSRRQRDLGLKTAHRPGGVSPPGPWNQFCSRHRSPAARPGAECSRNKEPGARLIIFFMVPPGLVASPFFFRGAGRSNLYVPFWSWETIEARSVHAVLELYQVERAALSLPGPVIGIGCFWESRRLLQTTFFRVGNDRCAAGRRASSWRRSSASRTGRTCSAAWA